MISELPTNNLAQLAKDSIGITAYQWVQDEKQTLSPQGKITFGVLLGIREFFAPALSRFDRESNYERTFRNSLIRLTTFPRDTVPYLLSMGAFIGAAHFTDISGVPSAAFLFSKFILNGVIHYEFNKREQVFNSSLFENPWVL